MNSLEVAREMWRRAARHAEAPVAVIEVICSDRGVHRRRLETRARDIDGFPEPTWEDVLRREHEWEDWQEERLVLDSAETLLDNVERSLAYVRAHL